jgi:hypothetical protein
MSDLPKQIANLKKQNEGMEISFNNKGIPFTKLNIDNIDLDTEFILIKDYNEYLKNISKNNRPPQVKEVKQSKLEETTINQKEKQHKITDTDDEDELTKETKITFSTICNMEDIKREFFSKEYDIAYELIRKQPFKFYKASYNYSDDYKGRPAFVAKNLLRGFVQQLEDYRKYLMVVFRCVYYGNPEENRYRYHSYWIVNSNDDLKTIIGSLYDDFDFIPVVDEERIVRMFRRMQKNEDENDQGLVGESYLH